MKMESIIDFLLLGQVNNYEKVAALSSLAFFDCVFNICVPLNSQWNPSHKRMAISMVSAKFFTN
jgi:hypothetical protein